MINFFKKNKKLDTANAVDINQNKTEKSEIDQYIDDRLIEDLLNQHGSILNYVRYAGNPNIKIEMEIVERMIDLNSKREENLFNLIKNNDLEGVEKAIENMHYISSALICACEVGNLKIAECLIRNGANVNSKDWEGKTVLIKEVCKGNLKIVKFLIKKGANVNLQDNSGRTALIYARENGNQEMIKLLITKNKVDINQNKTEKAIENGGRDAYSHARDMKPQEIIKYLVENHDGSEKLNSKHKNCRK